VFGSHLCNVLRRLRRICHHYGSSPVFLCSSATIQNPRELAERLTEQSFELVDRSGAPRGEKFFVFVNPPVVNQQLGIRRSYLAETRRVAAEFLKRNLQLIVFAQSRLSTEILTTYLKDDFEGIPEAPEQIRGYRGGYLPMRRREIEKGLREGAVRAVVSTNALELGIDIGALDVSIMAGYPGTIAATWQRAGRAGRRNGRSAAVMVASSAPLDQFVVRNPSYFFDASPERALIDPDNLHILVDHIKCAAFELPFGPADTFGRPDVQEILGILSEQGLVHRADQDASWMWTNESYPADAVSLRSVSSDNFVIVDITSETRVIGETDFTSGPSTLHPKAIYIIEGKLFQVERLDFEGRKAFVRSIDCDYYTTAINYAKVTPIDTFASDAGDGAGERVFETPVRTHGEVHVVSRVVGFKKIKFYTNENVGSGELDLPEQQMHTTAYWLTIPSSVMGALPYATDDRRDGVVGLAFALKQVAQLLLMCDGHDIGISIDGGETDLVRRAATSPQKSFVYDNYPGGIGFSAPLYEVHRELVTSTRRLIAECECENGCPGCVGPVGNTGPLAKVAALRILDLLLEVPPF
jgi:DEAD/DEAH box helicase domain-containing protein